jgi:hypothetical protein
LSFGKEPEPGRWMPGYRETMAPTAGGLRANNPQVVTDNGRYRAAGGRLSFQSNVFGDQFDGAVEGAEVLLAVRRSKCIPPPYLPPLLLPPFPTPHAP